MLLPENISEYQLVAFFKQFGSVASVAKAFNLSESVVEAALRNAGICISCQSG